MVSGSLMNKSFTLPVAQRAGRAFVPSRSFVQRPEVVRTCRKQESRQVKLRAGNDDVGPTYANGLIDLALEKDCLDEVHSDIDTLVGIFKEDESVREFLLNPMMPGDKKKDVIDKLAKDAKLTPYTVNFLGLLIDQDRLVSADSIFDAFEQRFCEIRETLVATVHCAQDLDDDQRYLVAKKLQEMTGQKNIKIKTSINKDLIGGFVVDYGSAQIDLSLKGQLEEVAQELVAGASAVA